MSLGAHPTRQGSHFHPSPRRGLGPSHSLAGPHPTRHGARSAFPLTRLVGGIPQPPPPTQQPSPVQQPPPRQTIPDLPPSPHPSNPIQPRLQPPDLAPDARPRQHPPHDDTTTSARLTRVGHKTSSRSRCALPQAAVRSEHAPRNVTPTASLRPRPPPELFPVKHITNYQQTSYIRS